jgi:hypothetical protein
MSRNGHIFLTIFFLTLSFCSFSQEQKELSGLKPNPEKELKFAPYLATRHGGLERMEEWKKSNTVLYYKELWYFAESFYVKRNYLQEGVVLDESMIDISRFESSRKANEEAIVVLPGFKDALVLIAADKLIYKPEFK